MKVLHAWILLVIVRQYLVPFGQKDGQKVEENVQCEIMRVVADEARSDSGAMEITTHLDHTGHCKIQIGRIDGQYLV